MDLFRKLFRMGPGTDYKKLVQEGAVILDVRTREEFQGGHIKSAVNIPLQNLRNSNLPGIKKETPVITCCASGMRSASAKTILASMGYTQVYNGGGWASLQNKLN